jgi:hypothetical protein
VLSWCDATKIGAGGARLAETPSIPSRAAKLYRYEAKSAQASPKTDLGSVGALLAMERSQPAGTSLSDNSGLSAICEKNPRGQRRSAAFVGK